MTWASADLRLSFRDSWASDNVESQKCLSWSEPEVVCRPCLCYVTSASLRPGATGQCVVFPRSGPCERPVWCDVAEPIGLSVSKAKCPDKITQRLENRYLNSANTRPNRAIKKMIRGSVCLYPPCGVVAQLIVGRIRNRTVPGSNPVAGTWVTAYFLWAGTLHTPALGQLSLANPLRVGKDEEQLCAAATTGTFPRSTSPGPGNSQRKLVGVRLRATNGRSAPANPMGFPEP